MRFDPFCRNFGGALKVKVAWEPVAFRVAVGFKSRRVIPKRRVGAVMRLPFAKSKLRRYPPIYGSVAKARCRKRPARLRE